MEWLEIKKDRGINYDPEFRPESLNLSGALALFAPTMDELESLKMDLMVNIKHTLDTVPRLLPQATDETLRFVCKGLDDLYVQQKVEGPRKAIQRIVGRQNHLRNPAKPRSGVTDDQIERAREYPMEDLIDGRIFKAGAKRTTHCPFHQERTPSFFIFPDNKYKCFGCGEHGDTIAFVMKRDGVKFIQAVEALTK